VRAILSTFGLVAAVHLCALARPIISILLILSVVAEAVLGFPSSAVRLRDEGLKRSLLGRISLWNLLIATHNGWLDKISMQVSQVRTTCK
jgi:hypothetical protein